MSLTADAATPPLFERFPTLREHIPWIPLGQFPTPVEERRVEGDGYARPVFIKRDDLCHDRYGGNKVRKLEFLLAAARERGGQRLITAGAAGSHHALATTVHGRALGFDVSLVLFPQPLTDHVRQVLLMDHALGAELRWTPRMTAVPFATVATRIAHWRHQPAVIPPGGSDATGTLGYVSAALELARQIEAGQAPLPSAIHVAAGTLGTAAGIALGLAMAGLSIPIHAARITGRIVANERALARLIQGASDLLRKAGAPVPPAPAPLSLVHLLHDQIGPGYGVETPAGRQARERFAAIGIQLDPTYTAKAAASLLAAPPTDPPPLFWHTLSATQPIAHPESISPDDLPTPFRNYLNAG